MIFYTLDQLYKQTTGIVYDAGGYHEGPNHDDILSVLDTLRSGLLESLRHHQLVDQVTRHPPRWKQTTTKDRVEPKWKQPTWLQHLSPDVRVTDNMIFTYQEVSVTIDPWMVEAVQHTVPAGMDIELWTDQNLFIRDIGYSEEDTSTHNSVDN